MANNGTTLQNLKTISSSLEVIQDLNGIQSTLGQIRDCFGLLVQSLSLKEAEELRKISLSLWNSSIRLSHEYPEDKEVIPTLRHLSCDLLGLCAKSDEGKLTLLRLLTKTGKIWCEVGNYSKSESAYSSAEEICEQLHHSTTLSSVNSEFRSLEFSLICYEIEETWKCSKIQTAISLISHAKQLIGELETTETQPTTNSSIISSISLLSTICYSISTQLFHETKYVDSISWLEQVIEFESHCKFSNTESKIFTKSLKLLSTCYIETNQIEKALSIINSSKQQQNSIDNLLLLFRIQLLKNNNNNNNNNNENSVEEIKSLSERILNHKELTPTIGLSFCELLNSNNFRDLTLFSFKSLSTRFSTDSTQYSMIIPRRIEFLLSNYDENDVVINSNIDEIISSRSILTLESLADIRHSIWNFGVVSFQSKKFDKSLLWFQKSLNLFGDSMNSEILLEKAKCLRLIGFCTLQIGDLKTSLDFTLKSLELESNSLIGLSLLFKIQINLNNLEDSINVIEKIAKLNNNKENSNNCDSMSIQKYLEVCSQLAFELDKSDIAAKALENILTISDGNNLAIPTRSLIKLILTSSSNQQNKNGIVVPQNYNRAQINRCCAYLSIASDKLKKVGPNNFFGPNSTNESQWFFAISWNLAKEAAIQKDFQSSYDLYKIAFDFSEFIPKVAVGNGSNANESKRMCLILAAASSLQISSLQNSSPTSPADFAKETISLIEKIKTLGLNSSSANDQSLPLLILMEFRAQAILGNKEALQKIISQLQNNVQGISGSVLETMADSVIGNNGSQSLQEFGIELLKKCLLLPSLSVDRRARVTRKLIQLQKTREDSLQIFEEVSMRFVNSNWPEQEIQWLSATSWNNGVIFYRLGDYVKAEKWMSISQKLMNGKAMSSEIAKAYSDVLEKLHISKH